MLMKNIVTTIGVSLLFAVASLAQNKPVAHVTKPDLLSPMYHLSYNAKWAAGEFNGRVTLYNIETGEAVDFEDENWQGATGKCVSDYGTVGGQYGPNLDLTAPGALWRNGEEWELLPAPEGCADNSYVPLAMTGDEKYLAGYGYGLDGLYYPCLWTLQDDGSYKAELLPCPEKDIWGDVPQMTTCQAISEDGCTIAGRFVDSTGYIYLIVVWKKDSSGDWSYEIVGEDYVITGSENPGPMPKFEDYVTAAEDTEEFWAQCSEYDMAVFDWWGLAYEYARIADSSSKRVVVNPGCLSSTGRYMAATFADKPRLYDLENGNSYTEYDINALATSVSDYGTLLVASPVDMPARTAYIVPAGTAEPILMSQWLEDNYEISYETENLTSLGSIGNPRIAHDESLIISWNTPDMVMGETMIIKLDGGKGVDEHEAVAASMQGNMLMTDGMASVSVYDLAGKCLCSMDVCGSTDLSAFVSGLVIVRVTTHAGTETFKAVVD